VPLKIPSEVRASVIRDWLNGKPRDAIAHDNVVSSGAVSNMVNKWRGDLTVSDADALRELGIVFRKLGITAPQCAIGFRLASIIKDLGVDEENFGEFVSQIYNQCKDIGLKPEYITYNTKQILDLLGSIPISEIPNYIQEKTKERQKLEEDIKKLEGQEFEAEVELMMALDDNKVCLAELEQYSKLKFGLAKIGISAEDIRRTTGIIQGVQKSGYNLDTIIQLISNWEASSVNKAHLEKSIEDLKDKHTNLQKECDRLEELISAHRLKESLFKQLNDMGLGLKELKLLFYAIKEVATENKVPENQAVQKFFEEIEKNYNIKLSYDSTLERLKSEIQETNRELDKTRSELDLNKGTAQVVADLLATGFNGQQILNFVSYLQSVHANANELESLKVDMKKYGSLKKAIEALSQKLGNLESQTSLQK
jgi:DNA-binding transcriptional MerR regulator